MVAHSQPIEDRVGFLTSAELVEQGRPASQCVPCELAVAADGSTSMRSRSAVKNSLVWPAWKARSSTSNIPCTQGALPHGHLHQLFRLWKRREPEVELEKMKHTECPEECNTQLAGNRER